MCNINLQDASSIYSKGKIVLSRPSVWFAKPIECTVSLLHIAIVSAKQNEKHCFCETSYAVERRRKLSSAHAQCARYTWLARRTRLWTSLSLKLSSHGNVSRRRLSWQPLLVGRVAALSLEWRFGRRGGSIGLFDRLDARAHAPDASGAAGVCACVTSCGGIFAQ